MRKYSFALLLGLLLAASPAFGAIPANNSYANRIVITSTNVSTNGVNTGINATTNGRESGEPQHNGTNYGASVWYTWTAPTNGQVTISASKNGINPPLDNWLAVYTGTAINALTLVAKAASDNTSALKSQIVTNVTIGTTFQI